MLKSIANSLLLRFLVSINMLVIALIVSAAIALGVTFRQESLSNLAAKADLSSGLVSGSLSSALWAFDRTNGEDILKTLAATDPDYVGSIVYDQYGAVFAKNGLIAQNPAGLIVEKRQIFHSSNNKVEPIGSIEIRLSPTKSDQLLASHMTSLVEASILALMAISLLLFAAVKSVIRPITAITKAMTSLSSGAVDTPIPGLDRKDEIGVMATSLDIFKRNAAETQALIMREALAEKRLFLAQRQLVDAIESIADAIVVFDADDRLVTCNGEYRRLFAKLGLDLAPGSPKEMVLDAYRDSSFFDTHDETFDAWAAVRVLEYRTGSGQAVPLRTADGRWLLRRVFRTQDEGSVIVWSDITEMKSREEELQRLQRHSQLILNSVGEGILGLDAQGVVTFANWMGGTLLKMNVEEMIGRDFLDFLNRDAPDSAAASVVRSAYRDGVAVNVKDALFRRSDGEIFHVEFLAAPILERETVTGAVVVFRDATLRLRYEAGLADQQHELERQVAERTAELRHEIDVRTKTDVALRASQKRLKGITDNLFESVLVIDRGGQLAFANLSARRMLGCDAIVGDIEGYPLDQLVMLREGSQDVGFAGSPWQRAILEGVPLRNDDAQFITSSGKIFSVAYACSPLTDDDGRRAAIISFRDIAALKQAQCDALQASRLATVGQLAAGIAHEINTPVQYVGDNLVFIGKALDKLKGLLETSHDLATAAAVIPSLTEVAARFASAATAAKLPFLLQEVPVAITESQDGISQIGRIVLSMKEFSHPGTNTKTTTDINRALESTLTVSRNAWKSAAVIEKDFAPSLPPVLCHAGEMNQVFLNLIVNAAQAIESSGKPLPGKITVSTRQDDDFVVIRVEDSGTGVPSALRDRIFDPFFTTKEVGKGTGQGLAICRDVVVIKHGGTLSIEGSEGEGAVFIIRLPIDSGNNQEDEIL